MRKPLQGSACGKAILIGEHAVVHGVSALAIPVERRLRVSLGRAPVPGLRAEFTEWFARVTTEELGRAWYPKEIASELPRGAGLGSSAALVVASLRALAPLVGWGEARLLELADEGERIFHGNPSGIDVRTVLFERPVRFQRGAELQVEPVTFRGSWRFSLWLTPPGPPTATMVARVSAALERNARRRALAEAARLVEVAETALATGAHVDLGHAMVAFHRWLARLDASTPRLDELVDLALARGALGAKLTGAGGGGAILVLEPPEERIQPPPGVEAVRFELSAPG